MAANGPVASHHEVSPAELVLHLFVALFDPVAQSVQAHELAQWGLLARQVAGEVPGGQARQLPPIGRGADGPYWLVRPIAKQRELGRPPALGVAVAKAANDWLPGTQRHLSGLSAHHRGVQLPGYCPAHQSRARMVSVGRLPLSDNLLDSHRSLCGLSSRGKLSGQKVGSRRMAFTGGKALEPALRGARRLHWPRQGQVLGTLFTESGYPLERLRLGRILAKAAIQAQGLGQGRGQWPVGAVGIRHDANFAG